MNTTGFYNLCHVWCRGSNILLKKRETRNVSIIKISKRVSKVSNDVKWSQELHILGQK